MRSWISLKVPFLLCVNPSGSTGILGGKSFFFASTQRVDLHGKKFHHTTSTSSTSLALKAVLLDTKKTVCFEGIYKTH